MKLTKKIIYITLAIVIIFSSGLFIGLNYNNVKESKQYYEIDTIYNIIVKDSVEHNINKKDSVIYNLKQQMQYDINKSKNTNNNDAIKLFYQLTSTD